MIAKALSHEPSILFLDEPTAGVDVELRREMSEMVRRLREQGVTIILTTHYIEEAEEMADRIGVINKGEIILVEERKDLDEKLGEKRLTIHLQTPLHALPESLNGFQLALSRNQSQLPNSAFESRPNTRVFPPCSSNWENSILTLKISTPARVLGRHLCALDWRNQMNIYAIRAIYQFELARFFRTLFQSIASPVISTSLYFIVFWLSDWFPHDRDQWHELWGFLSRFDYALSFNRKHFQRLVWDLYAQVFRHDL